MTAKDITPEEIRRNRIKVGIGLIIIVLIFRSCGGPKYSECECKEFFSDAAGLNLENNLTPFNFSEATRCVKDYVYNEEEGRINTINCWSKAWKNKQDWSGAGGATALKDFLQKASKCDCK